ncbi:MULTISPECIES: ribonuclease R [Methylomonas]|uniref:Ribonuclease R n=2 Tax=Methylomonas TaxID=416 RepID=A0A140E3U5_9GAMM|nr:MULTISPECIES: ribonuclease R [Methylomonas]AMK75069.1 ribonuclease R [Methylomonas denitrificans]OAI02560.1 ribonuclease R [Methylomonas methanica]TCV83117.1 RNAse R [Methylomonas methanica]
MTSNTDQAPDFSALVDPHAQREAEKYENPIPSRELILQLIQQAGKPLRRQQIAQQFSLETPDALEALRRRLRAMERDGQLSFNNRQKYCLGSGENTIAGRVLGHPEGFGFLKPDDGSEDLFLSPREMKPLMPNDRVIARVAGIDRRGRREAAVIEISERNTHQVVGRFFTEGRVAYVVPDNKKIAHEVLIAKEDVGHAKKGQIVVAEIIQQPSQHCQPLGRIIEVLGAHMAPGMEIEMAIRSHELPNQWPDQLLDEIKALTPQVPESAKQGREDIRKLPLVTIDGEDARDFDDAVYAQKTPKGWKLLVAIADVSHYVKVDTALDAEAKNRSTSVYFPEKVIPMLPEILSNGLCSLNPEVDRLCMVCELLINEEGNVLRSRFFEAVMRSHARLTYTDVARVLVDGDQKLAKKYAALLPHLQTLYGLYKVMRNQRELRGAMDFDTQETKIVFGPERKIAEIVPLQRNDAHKLIEEFMITANTAAARFLNKKKMPRLLRIHDGPGPEKLLALKTFLGELGLFLGGQAQPTPLDYMHLLESVKDRPDAHLIQTILLRSMSQAVYSPETKGHFGLALDAYAHFTSPIRRYPDLLVHRAIRHCLAGKSADSFYYTHPDMVLLGEHCSANERRADDATRDVVSWLKCEYMMDKIGEEFDGVISAVTGFGFFVELQSIYVEGLVHIASLVQDYFAFDASKHQLYGERTGVRYRLGDMVKIRVVRVNLDDKKIDFELMQLGKKIAKTKSSSSRKKVEAGAKVAKSDKDKKAPNKPKAKRRRRS